MKILKGKSKRSKIFALITLAVIAVLVGLNLLLSLLGHNKSVYIDMTPEGLYSVSDRMEKECAFIDGLDEDPDKNVKIIFCNDPDNLMDSAITRVPYFMALKLEKMFDNLEVETVNVNYNPTAVSKYKATSLSVIGSTDIIVSYGDRYRIAGAANFWTVGDDNKYFSYNGEYKLATIIKSVTLANDSNPVAYFVTGHRETCYDAADLEAAGTVASEQLKNLLLERGLNVKTIDLSDPKVESIPADCALLIINNPREDFKVEADRFDEFFYISETEKIDRYLTGHQGALMVTKDPALKLPVLENFLYEWGFEFSDSVLNAPLDESKVGTSEDTAENRTELISGVYDTDTESYGYAIYGGFSDLQSAPKTFFDGTGYVKNAFGESDILNEPGSMNISKIYTSFLKSRDNTTPYTVGSETEHEKTGSYDVAAVVTRDNLNSVTGEHTFSYVFCANDPDFFSNELLGNASYANFEIMSALVNSISKVDIYASSDLGGISPNSKYFGGKRLVSTELSEDDVEIYTDGTLTVNRAFTATARVIITVCVFAVVTAVFTVGVIVSAKRKHM